MHRGDGTAAVQAGGAELIAPAGMLLMYIHYGANCCLNMDNNETYLDRMQHHHPPCRSIPTLCLVSPRRQQFRPSLFPCTLTALPGILWRIRRILSLLPKVIRMYVHSRIEIIIRHTVGSVPSFGGVGSRRDACAVLRCSRACVPTRTAHRRHLMALRLKACVEGPYGKGQGVLPASGVRNFLSPSERPCQPSEHPYNHRSALCAVRHETICHKFSESLPLYLEWMNRAILRELCASLVELPLVVGLGDV